MQSWYVSQWKCLTKRKIVKIVCSNFSCDGGNLIIEPNLIFKAVFNNSLSNKKLPELSKDRTFCIDIFEAMTQTSCDLLRNIEDFMQNIA